MHNIRIYYKDTDAGGVVYYANYLGYFEAARTEFLRERGVDLKHWVAQGIQFVVTRVEIDYLSSAKYGDTLTVETECHSLSGVRFELINRAVRGNHHDVLARAKTTLACVNETGKPIRIPQEIHNTLKDAMESTQE